MVDLLLSRLAGPRARRPRGISTLTTTAKLGVGALRPDRTPWVRGFDGGPIEGRPQPARFSLPRWIPSTPAPHPDPAITLVPLFGVRRDQAARLSTFNDGGRLQRRSRRFLSTGTLSARGTPYTRERGTPRPPVLPDGRPAQSSTSTIPSRATASTSLNNQGLPVAERYRAGVAFVPVRCFTPRC